MNNLFPDTVQDMGFQQYLGHNAGGLDGGVALVMSFAHGSSLMEVIRERRFAAEGENGKGHADVYV